MDDIVYFSTQSGCSKAYLADGSWAFVEESLLKVMRGLDPDKFFRANRQMIVNIDSIDRIRHTLFRDFEICLKPPFAGTGIKIYGDWNSELVRMLSGF